MSGRACLTAVRRSRDRLMANKKIENVRSSQLKCQVERSRDRLMANKKKGKCQVERSRDLLNINS